MTIWVSHDRSQGKQSLSLSGCWFEIETGKGSLPFPVHSLHDLIELCTVKRWPGCWCRNKAPKKHPGSWETYYRVRSTEEMIQIGLEMAKSKHMCGGADDWGTLGPGGGFFLQCDAAHSMIGCALKSRRLFCTQMECNKTHRMMLTLYSSFKMLGCGIGPPFIN